MDQGGDARCGGKAKGVPYVVTPASRPGRFVFASPHSGTHYPDDMAASPHLDEAGLRSAEDALIDRLIATGPSEGASVIAATVGRAYLDLNRGPDELDPALIEGVEAGSATLRTSAGYGVVPRLSGDGHPLYDLKLSLAEAAGRIDRVHRPYHAALSDLMLATREREGSAVLIDWHSMPSRVTRTAAGVRGVDVVLGDRHGTACDPALTRRLKALFESLGWRVALNHPYAGGWTTQVWGRPAEGFHAVQIELNRALYLDEATRRPGPGWSRCEKGVARVIAGLLADG
ncbi:MAG: N-formylglutamate amidohydrolase [Alphaproteobacteria bacterium]|nr:MAG: N-formylglutamate amidohydrolase [Alphaproteobacteria bacterium]